MAFSSFTNRLPDPNWTIHDSGDGHASNYTAGPGFASVKFSSEQPVSLSRTNSGRVITRSIVAQRWKIKITYNPMTREQFEPVYNFLLEKRGRLKPFFVTLPQHTPRSTTSATYTVQANLASGTDNILCTVSSDANANLKPGDMFTIADSGNSNHKKAYQIVRVNDSTNKLSSDTALNTTTERRLYIVPPLEKAVNASSTLSYTTPLIRVVQTSDVQEYDLGTNNLYSFSLSLEEAQV